MTKYRVFVEDVGINKFSAVNDATAPNPRSAIKPFATDRTRLTWYGRLLIALPHNRPDLWPHPTKGTVPSEALKYR